MDHLAATNDPLDDERSRLLICTGIHVRGRPIDIAARSKAKVAGHRRGERFSLALRIPELEDEDAYDQDDGENVGEAILEAEEDGRFDPEERHIRDTATADPDGRWECPVPNCGKLLSSLEIMVRHWKGCKKRSDYQYILARGAASCSRGAMRCVGTTET
ncbi:predicted protein [Postia placenta Mad-698-R]|nr:predicted protein [Postia placenta Mad-698-R]